MAYLVNTLPLRDRMNVDEGFLAFLKQVDRTVREAKKHSDVPGALIAREVLPPSSGAPFPLLNVLVNSPLRYRSAVLRYTAGFNVVFDASVRLKLSAELYDFSDFEDEVVANAGVVAAF